MRGFRRTDYGPFPGDLARKRIGDMLIRKAGMWPGDRALDPACGTGFVAVTLARAFTKARVVAVDARAEALRKARENATAEGCASRMDFVLALAETLPFRAEAFEVAATAFGLSRLDEPDEALAETHRVTAFHGKLLAADVNPARSRQAPDDVKTNLFDKALWDELQEIGWGKLTSQKADLLVGGTVLEVLMAKRFDTESEDAESAENEEEEEMPEEEDEVGQVDEEEEGWDDENEDDEEEDEDEDDDEEWDEEDEDEEDEENEDT